MQDQFFYLFSAVLVGVVIGAVLMYYFSHAAINKQKSVEEVELELQDYKNEVADHFEKTADLIEELTHNYKNVFDHLGQSAKELMSEDQLKLQIEKRKGKKVTLEFLTDESQEAVVADSGDSITGENGDIDYSKI